MVIYVDSKKTSPELLKEFIDGFSEKIKDITMEDDKLPTTFDIKQGFGTAPEPTDASRYLYRIRSTFNPLSLNEYGIEGNRNLEGKLSCFEDQVKAPEGYEISIEGKLKIGSSKMSWNQYCGRLLILSAYIARHRLNRGEKDGFSGNIDCCSKSCRKKDCSTTGASDQFPATFVELAL